MLDLALRDLKGHKARTFLTVLGVVIAIAAIVSLGSVSSGMNEFAGEQLSLLSGLVTLEEADSFSGPGPPQGRIPVADVDDIEDFANVDKIARFLVSQRDFGDVTMGMNFDALDLFQLDEIEFEEGDWPGETDYEVVLGFTVAETKGLTIGDSVEIEGEVLIVAGVLEETGKFLDFATILFLDVAQDLYDEHDFLTGAYVKATDVKEIDSLMEQIEDEFPNIDALSDEDNLERVQEVIGQVRLITLGIGFITALVAAIGIINTMFMSVFERKRQIGIMKAIGASEQQVIRQVLEEGVLLATIGSITGILIGFAGTALVNRAIGIPLAKVTPGLAIGSFIFGLAITLLASTYPALQAARIDPIEAMRS